MSRHLAEMSGSFSDTIIAGVIRRVASRRAGPLAFADIPLIARAGPMFGRAGLTESHVCWARKAPGAPKFGNTGFTPFGCHN